MSRTRTPWPHHSGNRNYRHEAFLWRDEDWPSVVSFVTDALAGGEAVMAALTSHRAAPLRAALGSAADEVRFVDMAQLGHNPARIIPAWRRFVDDHAARGTPTRGISEPTWLQGCDSAHRPERALEGQLHEALLNVAVEPDTPFWLLCLYEASRLSDDEVEHLYRSHPAVVADGSYRGSHLYGGRDYVEGLWGSELPPIDGPVRELRFSRDEVAAVGTFVTATAYAGGMSSEQAADLAEVVQALAGQSVYRGAPAGVVRVWARPTAVTCEVQDSTVLSDPLSGRKPSSRDQRNALWTANERCDLVQARSTATGTTVRVHAWL